MGNNTSRTGNAIVEGKRATFVLWLGRAHVYVLFEVVEDGENVGMKLKTGSRGRALDRTLMEGRVIRGECYIPGENGLMYTMRKTSRNRLSIRVEGGDAEPLDVVLTFDH